MDCAPVRSIIPSLKLGDYLSVQAHKPCSISHLEPKIMDETQKFVIREHFKHVHFSQIRMFL